MKVVLAKSIIAFGCTVPLILALIVAHYSPEAYIFIMAVTSATYAIVGVTFGVGWALSVLDAEARK